MSQTLHEETPGPESIHVPEGADRFQEARTAFGMPIVYKVAAADTAGALLILENLTPRKGGPPRHLHHQQEEWFYVVQGEYIVEVGTQEYRLGPGDSLLAPRQVPHVWAYIGDAIGKLLIAFQPAGQMEAFFRTMTQFKEPPARDEIAVLFQAHGMSLIGPPLKVD